MNSPGQRFRVALIALYGLRWATAALHTQRRLAPRAAAGDVAARASVTQRAEAGLFGVPNSVYGIAYYLALIVLAVSGRLARDPWSAPARAASALALLRTFVLLLHLLFTRTWCSTCMRAHAANAVLALLLIPRRPPAHE